MQENHEEKSILHFQTSIIKIILDSYYLLCVIGFIIR